MKSLRKKITAALLVICIGMQSQSVFALYYKRSEPAAVSGSSLSYTPYNQEAFERRTERIGELLSEPDSSMEISTLLDECYNEYCRAYEQAYIAELDMNRNYNTNTIKNHTEAYSISLDVSKEFSKVIKSVYDSEQYRSLLENIFGSGSVENIIGSLPSDEFYSISKQEQELVNKYYDAFGKSDECAKIFVDLVNLRNKMAKAEGYNNYVEYANNVVYNRDYSAEQTAELCESVSKYLKPFVSKLLDATLYAPHDSDDISDDQMINLMGSFISDINGELKSSFDYMTSNKLYDISYSENKLKTSGAFTLCLPKSKVPFLFIAPADQKSDNKTMHSFIHEFGHYSAMLKDPALDENWIIVRKGISVDTSEVQSQGLEMLFLDYYGHLFGRSATYERYSQMLSTVTAILDGCMFNEWQIAAYSSENVTVAELNKKASELIHKYYGFNYTSEAAQTVWTGLMHNFVSPMYYLSYSVSGVAALDILKTDGESRADAIDKYMKFSALGTYYPFMDAMAQTGIADVFEEENMKSIAEGVGRMFGLNYSDVNYDSWYVPYIYSTSAIFDATDEGLFKPDDNITRSDFVELIGKMYDYYVGIGREYSVSFSDVSSYDDSAPYIAWAYSEGIVDGYEDGRFGGNDSITREQLVAVMYRLASLENKNYKPERGALDGFADSASVSEWAIESMGWAVNSGIIDGRDNSMIEPQGNATRAEAAKIASSYIFDNY